MGLNVRNSGFILTLFTKKKLKKLVDMKFPLFNHTSVVTLNAGQMGSVKCKVVTNILVRSSSGMARAITSLRGK